MRQKSDDSAVLFYDSIFSPIVGSFHALTRDRAGRGSGRPPGDVQREWRSLIAQASDALGSGLEALLLTTHLDRIEALPDSAVGTSDHDPSRVEAKLCDLLWLPDLDASKIEHSILLQFGIVRECLSVPEVSHFTAKSKPRALGGNGRGQAVRFEGHWCELSAMLNTVQHVLNSTARTDEHDLELIPPTAVTLSKELRGSLYAITKAGQWSIQMPHAATALRIFVSVFNSVYLTLKEQSKSLATEQTVTLDLRPPDEVVPFPESAREEYR